MKSNFTVIHSNIRNVLATGVVATTVIMNIGMGQAFAAENDTAQPVQETTVDQSANTPVTESAQTSTVSQDSNEATSSSENTTTESTDAGLVPGDTFYFIDELGENIQLALETDSVDEAELLNQFAEERMAEANQLIEQGETNLADETIQKAVDTQQKAISTLDEAVDSEGGTKETIATSSSESETAVQDKTTATALDPDTQAKVAELRAKFSKNIAALTLVMNKVQNPQAKEAIAKNIAKAQVKLEQKIAKRLAQDEKRVQHQQGRAVSPVTDEDEHNEAVDTVAAVGDKVETPTDQAPIVKSEKEAKSHTEEKAEVKQQGLQKVQEIKQVEQVQQREAAKEIRNEVKQTVNHAVTQAKQEVQQKKEEIKQKVAEKKEEVKQKQYGEKFEDRKENKGQSEAEDE